MDLRQAQIRNMHSKCRCSYVLQFTRHHRVSSVLHRPPSQMIHCIVLCLDSLNRSQEGWASQQEIVTIADPVTGKMHNLRLGETLQTDCSSVPAASGRLSRASNKQSEGRLKASQSPADKRAPKNWQCKHSQSRQRWSLLCNQHKQTDNDPSAGSPTETLLRLLLPLNATVWSSSRQAGRVISQPNSPRTSLKRSIGSSDGRCVQRAGT